MKKLINIVLLLGFAHVAIAGNQNGNNNGSHDDEKVSKDLPKGTPTTWVNVIIQFNSVSTKDGSKDLEKLLKEINKQADDDWQKGKQQGQYGEQKGNHDDKKFDSIKAISVRIPLSMVASLKANPLVRYVSFNRPQRSFLDLTTAAVSASVAWQSGFDGTGVGVAVIDSGVSPDRDLTGPNGITSRVVYSESFVAGQNANDVYGHGTHVAGIVGSAGRDSTGAGFKRTFKGVAPNANIINLRVLDQNGAGYESDVIAAIERAIQLKNTYNIRVINLSLGHPVYESYKLDPLCQAVEAAWKAGIVVVVAAGNYGRDNSLGTKGYGTIASPGNDPYVITVGAMKANGTPYTADDTIASYSSKGPTLVDHIVKPDLVAPGNQVISLLVPNCTLVLRYPKTLLSNSLYETIGASGKSGDYFVLSGTSMATPVVAGAAALLIQKNPSLTPDQVKARLMKTATKIGTLYSTGIDANTRESFNNQSDIFTVGAGYLNISAALANYDLVTRPAISPTAVFNAITRKISISRDFSVLWGDSIIWGDSLLFGSFVFSRPALNALDESVLWGDSVIWGDALASGFSILWGDSVNAVTTLTALSADDSDDLDVVP